ncbi:MULTISPECIES: VacJ family lipoprotein [Pseudomonas]|uniref:Phospholipid-binding lipoprotein MlaA n=2 Tax=Pseudomonas flexibilis TaxID=706570 RepID=A0A1N6P5G0_9PSED|nr:MULTISPECIES: VacJ family lipoprotein [Pseudomonas]KHL70170.1 VacJ family lipoprotein [Pseudomonas flexibilis]SCY18089.1 phospholipid-binding lipoprotein MlaA [Pseudomonas flexibilis]SIP99631.1 phospholipid-binding lipoprotein MlaA [Pseudomonas flexibilis]
MAVFAVGMSVTVRCLAVCAVLALPLQAAAQAHEDDPWEGFNRSMFAFNETLDTYALKPLAKGYRTVTPDFLETGIGNVFSNVGEVRNLTNNLLQGKLHAAGVDTARLLFNSTFGLLGFFDVATRMGLQRNDEDFGQTLGVWGLGSGPYLVLPFLGPSTVRDGLARFPDSYNGLYTHLDHVRTRNQLLGLDVVDTRASFLDAERLIQGDKYTFLRNVYLQNREFKVRDGMIEDDF